MKVSATEFQNQVGRFLDAAQREPVTVTSHGRDRVVVLSPELYRRLAAAAGSTSPAHDWNPGRPQRLNDPVAIALSVINTSTPRAIDRRELRDAISNKRTRHDAHARILINEVGADVLAGMVARKFTTWGDLASLARRVGIGDREKETLIRRMAGIALE